MNREHRYFPAIDGLRAVAVLAVIVNHFKHSILPSGYLGVDVFFVISGFVITLSLMNERDKPLGTVLTEFYSRRIRRLAPPLGVMVLVTALFVQLFDISPFTSLATGITSLFGLSNFLLFYLATDYFGPSAQLNPFTHTWSLGVEEQFYFIFPALLLSGLRNRRFGVQSRLRLILIMSVLSFVGFAALYDNNQSAAYFLIPFRFWELGLGCVLAMLAHQRQIAYRDRNTGGIVIGLLVLMVVTFALPESWAVLTTPVAVVLSLAVILSIWRSKAPTHPILTNKVVLYIGKISYSLYLWHWAVICLSRWTIGISWWTVPLQLALMLILAVLSYHLLETPLRRRLWFGRHSWSIISGLAAMSIVSVAVMGSYKTHIPGFSGVKTDNESVSIDRDYVTEVTGRLLGRCEMTALYKKPSSELPNRLNYCTADIGAPKTLLFVGDSHANDLGPMADLIYKAKLANVINLSEHGCQVPPPEGASPRCFLAMDFLHSLPEDEAADTVIVIRNNIAPKRAQGNLTTYVASLQNLVTKLTGEGFDIVYVAPAPKYYGIGPGTICSTQWFRPSWALPESCSTGFPESRSEALGRRAEFMEALDALAASRDKFYIFDPFDMLCGGSDPDTCSAVLDNGELTYRDASHLTVPGSKRLFQPFVDSLRAQGLI